MRSKKISKKKQDLLDSYQNSPFSIGDSVIVSDKILGGYSEKPVIVKIVRVSPNLIVKEASRQSTEKKIKESDIISKEVFYIGANPFDDDSTYIRNVSFSLESIIHALYLIPEKRDDKPYEYKGIIVKEVEFNPYVYVNGKKEFYQRGYVWNLENRQNLIESIYQNISCGKVLVRRREFEEVQKMINAGETDVSFFDVVDGKQRIEAIRGFVQDEFPDIHGNIFSDLSDKAQMMFMDTQLISYAIMENVSDDKVVKQFLKLNHAGVPQSREHLEFVMKLNESFKEKV